jgi:hypothetical protein
MHQMRQGALGDVSPGSRDMPELLWGTTKARPATLNGSRSYRGRVHIVHPKLRRTGWCGLPVDAVWSRRPPAPARNLPEICPECTINYLVNAYPVDSATSGDTEVLPAVATSCRTS